MNEDQDHHPDAAWLIAIVLAPLVFALVATYVVLRLAALVVRLAFASVVLLSNRPTRQRIELYDYERR